MWIGVLGLSQKATLTLKHLCLYLKDEAKLTMQIVSVARVREERSYCLFSNPCA